MRTVFRALFKSPVSKPKMGGWQSHPEQVIGERLAKRVPEIPSDIKNASFHFENLALEGGGCKTYAYLGSLKVT